MHYYYYAYGASERDRSLLVISDVIVSDFQPGSHGFPKMLGVTPDTGEHFSSLLDPIF
jgi:hypothetical protein